MGIQDRVLSFCSGLYKMVPTFIWKRKKDDWGRAGKQTHSLDCVRGQCFSDSLFECSSLSLFQSRLLMEELVNFTERVPKAHLPPCGRTRTFSGEQGAVYSPWPLWGQGKGLASSLKCFLVFCLVYAVRTKILFSLCLIQPTDFERQPCHMQGSMLGLGVF